MDDVGIGRVNVSVCGVELTARPIEFEFDGDGLPVRVLKYETTCPSCGCLIFVNPGSSSVSCSECGGRPVKSDSVLIRKSGQITVRKSSSVGEYPFCDPIADGVFRVDEL